jgi:hypothetical protein
MSESEEPYFFTRPPWFFLPLGGLFFLFQGISAKAVVTILSMKIDLCCAATKKNPERFNARGVVSHASTRFF